MTYTLLMPTGKIMQFYIKNVAELYCNLYGGVVVSKDILLVAEKQQTEKTC